MTNSQLNTQQLSIVANFITVEEASNFLVIFERNLSFASICSKTFRQYPKFEHAYWFDWVLIVEDINIARNTIRNCFGIGWIKSGSDEIWNAENRQELLVPLWANLLEPNLISVAEALQLNSEPQMEQGETFISISTQGEVTGIYPTRLS